MAWQKGCGEESVSGDKAERVSHSVLADCSTDEVESVVLDNVEM